MAESREIVWSLGCDVTIEDFDSTIEEIKVGDISLSGVVSVGELPVDVDSDRVNVMDLDVSFSVDGVHSTIIESQVVPHARIVEIESYSPEATNEKRYAASAYAAKKILDSLTETNNNVSKNENAIGNLQTAVNELEKKVDEGGGSGDSHWYLGNDDKLHTDYDIVVHGNAIIEGDTSSGGDGQDIPVGGNGTVTGIRVSQTSVLEPDEQGIVDMTETLANLEVDVGLSDYVKKNDFNSTIDDINGQLNNKADKTALETLAATLADMWTLSEDGTQIVTTKQVLIKNNLIVSGDTASGGEGEDITVGLDEQAVLDLLKEEGYVTKNDIAGLIPDDYVNSAELTEIVNDINAKIAKKADSSALQTLQNEVDNIEAVLGMDEEAEGVINTWNEVKAFLDGYSSSDDLATILSSMNADIAKRALQSELEALGLIVDGLGNNKADKSSVYTKDEIDGKVSTINGSINTINGNITNLTNNKADKTSVYTKTEIDSKVSTINDAINGIDGRVDVVEAWKDLLGKYIVIEGTNVRIKTNLVIDGDAASGGSGEDIVVGIQGIKVNNYKYEDSGDGYVDLTDAFNSIDVSGELANYYTKDEVDGKIANFATTDALTSGLSGKVDKVSGKALSTNDFTDALLTKLNGIAAGAEVNVQSDWNATSGDAFIKNKPTIPTNTNQLDNGAGYITSAALNGYATQQWVNNQGYAKTTDIPTLKSLMGGSAIGGTTSYIYWNGSAWATKALGDRAFDSTAYQPLATAINTGNIGSYAPIYNASGNVLIGTTTDSGAKLTISNPSSRDVLFLNSNASQGPRIFLAESNTLKAGFGYDGTYKVMWFENTSAGTGIYIHNNGNVGIGVDNPQYKLDVNGNVGIGDTTNQLKISSTAALYNTSATGGWNRRFGFSHSDTILFAFGAYGNGSSLSYGYIGTSYENPWVKITNNETTINGNLVVSGDVASGGAGQETTAYLPMSGGNVDWLTIGGYSAIHSGNISQYTGGYLPLSGGTIKNGSVRNPLSIDTTNTTGAYLVMKANGVNKAYFGYDSSLGALIQDMSEGNTILYLRGGAGYIGIGKGWDTLIHSGNIGSYALPISGGTIKNSNFRPLTINSTYNSVTELGIANNGVVYSGFGYSSGYTFIGREDGGNYPKIALRHSDGAAIYSPDNFGTIRILIHNGNISQYTGGSDIRYKSKVRDVSIDIEAMVNAPFFDFYWMREDMDKDIHAGTSAQYWEMIHPSFVSGTDFKALNYGALGVAMGISLAKKVKELEAEIKRLKEVA